MSPLLQLLTETNVLAVIKWTGALISGAGLGKLLQSALEWYRERHSQAAEDDEREFEQGKAYRAELREDISKLRGRLDEMDERLERAQEQIVASAKRESELKARLTVMSNNIDRLLAIVDDLREQLGLDPMPPEEKQQFLPSDANE